MSSSVNELMEIYEKFLKAEENLDQEKCAVSRHLDLDSRKEKKEISQRNIKLQRSSYNKMRKIFQSIPNFWLTAFLSHYALGILLTEEDQKIFKSLKSLDVKDTEVETGIPGYTITFSFKTNPYFKNATLKKKIVYTCRGIDVRGSNIEWEVIPTGNRLGNLVENGNEGGCADGEISFFTLFFDDDDDLRGIREEVAMLIIEDFWPNAISHYCNGNLTYEEECAAVEGFHSYLSCNEDEDA